MASDLPVCRWGIITTGLISGWFVDDLVLERPDARAKHIIQAIGTSSIEKAQKFVAEHCPSAEPTLYAPFAELYADDNVDCVYIGTPHSFHKQNCLDAIAAGRNVLCEKAFTINAKEAKEVVEAARRKGVYLAEAMWLRHRPLDKVIGDVFRTFSEFGMEVDFPSLQDGNRYKHIHLGAGTLLDIGLYALTFAFLTLDPATPGDSERPTIQACQTHNGDGLEITSSILLHYPRSGKQAIVTSTHVANSPSDVFCTVQGTKGFIEIEGFATSFPSAFTVYRPRELGSRQWNRSEGERYEFGHAEFHKPDRGFVYEADNTALDISAGRKESTVMPLRESIRVMEITDEIRRQGKTKYPQDDEQ